MTSASVKTALYSALILILLIPGAWAQSDRVSGRIDASRPVVLQNQINPHARIEDDRGSVDDSLDIPYATLHLKSTAAQQAALEVLLVEQQNPASPDYHRWLSPDEFGDRFGVSRNDVAKITAWLEFQGLKVHDVARGRRWITFSGPAGSVGRTFRTSFHRYLTDGEMHFANTNAPSIPEALTEIVDSIEGLDDYYPTPAAHVRRVLPNYTNSAGAHLLAPDDLATIYNLKSLYTAGIDGTGQTIAIVGASQIDLAEMRAFRSRFNLPSNDPKTMLTGADPGIVPSAQQEANLDLQWAGAVARNASLIFVYSKSINAAVQYAIDQRVAPVISDSFLSCEPTQTTRQRPLAQQANAEGITWIAATGDVGAAGCEVQGKLPQAAKGYAVSTPSSIPEVTAVGGTEFDDASGSFWNRGNTSNLGSVVSYIPERAWNDSIAEGDLAASTGGASILYPKPWWQTGPGVPNDNARHLPDVAMTASWFHDGYLLYKDGNFYVSGGTSAATPVFAGVISLLNQYLVAKGKLAQAGLGNINPTLYRLAQTAPDTFHDIVTGDNIVPCLQGTPDCANGSFGFTAGPGYDLVTGLGSVDANTLASNWTIATPSTTTVTASPATVSFSSSVKLTATVTGGAATGDITFLVNDTTVGTATLVSSSGSTSATLTVPAIQIPMGANSITAVFSGSANLAGSAGATTVTVTASAGASAVVASVSPDPVVQHPPDADGYTWTYTIRLTNESAVPATLKKVTIGSTDYTSSINDWFGSATIPGNASVSVTLSTKNLSAPVDRVFGFSGTDSSGATWTQQVTASFVTRVLEEPWIVMTTPSTIPPDSTADPSCRWAQSLVVEELGGYDIEISTLKAGSVDFSSSVQQIFGTTRLAPFGRLQGTVCWSSATSSGSKTLSLTGVEMQSQFSATVSASASTTLAASASTPAKASVSPALIDLSTSPRATLSLSFTGGSPQWTARVSPSNSVTAWLAISPASGTGSAQLTITGSPSGLANGVYNATVLIQSTSGSPQFTAVPVVMVVGGSPDTTIWGVAHGASYKTVFAPGMLLSVFGTNLSPGVQHAPLVPLPLAMQGVTATVNGYSAPLLDVTPGQVNLQVPYEVGAGTAILAVNNNGKVAFFPFQVQPSAPGIFMTLDGANNLVPYSTGKRGQILLAFITGEGDVTPALITGRTPTTTDINQMPAPMLPLSITVGGVDAITNFVGIPPGLVGVTQINFTIPPGAPLGPQPVVVTVGGVSSAPVTLNVTQ